MDNVALLMVSTTNHPDERVQGPPSEARQVAAEFLEIIPLVMRVVSADLRQTEDALHPANFRLLGMLSKRDWSLGDLAEKQAVSGPTMSRAITALERRGLVVRRRSEADRRIVRVAITREGRAVLDDVHRQMVDRLAEVIAPLSEESRSTMCAGLRLLREVFETGLSDESAKRHS